MSSGTHWMGAMLALRNKFESSLHRYDNCMGVELGNNIHATLLTHHRHSQFSFIKPLKSKTFEFILE